jgi:hypothetical protein
LRIISKSRQIKMTGYRRTGERDDKPYESNYPN